MIDALFPESVSIVSRYALLLTSLRKISKRKIYPQFPAQNREPGMIETQDAKALFIEKASLAFAGN
jgi:hypothetical protein